MRNQRNQWIKRRKIVNNKWRWYLGIMGRKQKNWNVGPMINEETGEISKKWQDKKVKKKNLFFMVEHKKKQKQNTKVKQ